MRKLQDLKLRLRNIKTIRNNKGALSVEMSGFIVIAVTFLVFFLSYMPVITQTQTLNTMAHELSRYIEVRGAVGSDTQREFERICEVSTLYGATYVVNGQIESSGKIQLQDTFTVVITSKANVSVGGLVSVPVTIKGKAAGRSEVYHK